ncbi:hypothetical protein AVEN_82858-1 [Araneus ventricosus]|uniref:Uncharacterized protein n=1 Tax=Araneus ventricosus TaxID=182803 RepID=A0A4Y2FBA7_ARAVE|nr:hypothetical protein AVEN_82858-1 [Araneus ventricosus]
MSKDLIPVSLSHQRSLSNDVEVGAPINRDTGGSIPQPFPNLTISCIIAVVSDILPELASYRAGFPECPNTFLTLIS